MRGREKENGEWQDRAQERVLMPGPFVQGAGSEPILTEEAEVTICGVSACHAAGSLWEELCWGDVP